MTDWQPIESAPRDGTPVLLYLNDGQFMSMTTARFSYGQWSLIETGGYASDSDVWPDPTHWMPLPEPPK